MLAGVAAAVDAASRGSSSPSLVPNVVVVVKVRDEWTRHDGVRKTLLVMANLSCCRQVDGKIQPAPAVAPQ